MTKTNKIGSNRSFGLVFFVFFFVIAFWSFRGDFNQIKLIPLYISIFFLFFGLINSRLLTPLNRLWIKFGEFLGSIIAPIIMAIIFFFLVTPLSFLVKLFGKDILRIKYSNKNSYWIKRDKNIGSMKRQF